MKKLIFGFGLLLLITQANAQQSVKPDASPVRTSKEVSSKGTTISERLNSTAAYPAKAPTANRLLYIADPTLRALNTRRAGTALPLFGNYGIWGVPKGTYGFAKGQVWLRTTDATSIGGTTGISSVGTGSSSGGIGMGGLANGVNGKSPYAGPTIWGSAQGLNLPDSLLRRRPTGDRD